ncbi:uncharacterized protein F5147DRAFT_689081 [Suillus discolor]|uniref:Secreted protein n=1 Tax=Suillus discolor TaxID=1912936 RepID=A0A9P7JVD8_9AGAM|nr:uncharacterized protein F5147DRAFT_689081 [Suillus discolor]KAG2110570.1 hypothetical protein F5147DRAFT_689081 [Suillus discolor]
MFLNVALKVLFVRACHVTTFTPAMAKRVQSLPLSQSNGLGVESLVLFFRFESLKNSVAGGLRQVHRHHFSLLKTSGEGKIVDILFGATVQMLKSTMKPSLKTPMPGCA